MDPPRKRTVAEAYESFSVDERRSCLARAIERIKSRVRHFEFRNNRQFERAEAYISASWVHLSGDEDNPAPEFVIQSADHLAALLITDATFQILTAARATRADSAGRTELGRALGSGGYARPVAEDQGRDQVLLRAYNALRTELVEGDGRLNELAVNVLDLIIAAAESDTVDQYIHKIETESRKRPDGTKKQVRLRTPKLGWNVTAIAGSLGIRPDYASKVLKHLRTSMAAVGGPTFFGLLWDLSELGEHQTDNFSQDTAFSDLGASAQAGCVLCEVGGNR